MRIDLLTIFPDLFTTFLRKGMVERARRKGVLEIHTTDLREFTNDRYHAVDDRPYGGGPGMLLKPEPVFRAIDVLTGAENLQEKTPSSDVRWIVLCPAGERLKQTKLEELAQAERCIFLCGRYEGFDDRILQAYPWERISIGEFVLSGGEVPAMVLIEGIARLLPGVLQDPESSRRDSFSQWAGADGLDHPHYTRPPEYRGTMIPEVLVSGNHQEIEAWRRREAGARNLKRQRD